MSDFKMKKSDALEMAKAYSSVNPDEAAKLTEFLEAPAPATDTAKTAGGEEEIIIIHH